MAALAPPHCPFGPWEQLRLADVREFEKVHIVNINNGARFETYAILGKPESGEVCVNGAAARLVHVGDIVIIMTFAQMEERELQEFSPKIIKVDAKNVPAG